MARFNVVDQDNFEPGKGLELEKDDVVDRDCYRDTEDIVMDFIRAGERLAEFRRNDYDVKDELEDVNVPLDRMDGFDVATASMMLEQEADRISKIKTPELKPASEGEEEQEVK